MNTVLVVRNSADHTRDYYLPRDYAEAEYKAGRLARLTVYNAFVTYYDPDSKHAHQAVSTTRLERNQL